MVLLNEDRGLGKGGLVVAQEETLHVPGGVCRVEAVDKAAAVQPREVVAWLVAVRQGVQHGVPELPHLPQGRQRLEVATAAADAEGERGREVRQAARGVCRLLGAKHAVQTADDGLHDAPRREDARCLQVGLVHGDDLTQSRVVRAIAAQEAGPQVAQVGLLDLAEAVVLGGHAVAGHLRVRVVADANDHPQAQPVGFVQEGRVVVGRVVAVEAHGVRAHLLHDLQIGPAPRSPHGLRSLGHEVVLVDAAIPLARHGAIANALEDLPGFGGRHCKEEAAKALHARRHPADSGRPE
mmetsp:Transcript_83156/g.252107  ORF Transcript_83156/g.252107 Transcript_83156/m.252107 type:complete len:295 (+) Transcript_83156:1747-2631(+)